MIGKGMAGIGVAVLAAAVALGAPPRRQKPAVHPQVDATESCEECHAGITPDVVKEWNLGKHGLHSVKCFVCHGSTGKDFVKRPPKERCVGCHAEEVASLARPKLAGKDCFSCHEPHPLSSHLPELRGGEK